ncbi:MAG TPA: response regulator transcription factor [Chthoniobacteraceae bacterium]|jgi:DNA-binding NarL/FixJ family response regulator|nr:response regulator transcription factor [Chthoniobacteraceae bacterium]
MKRRRVFLVDDHPLVREWLANVIARQRDLFFCGHAEGQPGCTGAVLKKRADLVIVEVSLKEYSGFDLIAEIKRSLPRVKIVVLTDQENAASARRAISAGAAGYILKRESTPDILSAIRRVLAGDSYISRDALSRHEPAAGREEPNLAPLSGRELEIFHLLGAGKSTRHIAEALGISIKTVQVHCGHIREKCGFGGPSDLLSSAIRWNERHVADQ